MVPQLFSGWCHMILYFLSDSYLYSDSWYYQLCGACSTQTVLPLLSCMFVLGAAALRWLPWSTMVPLIDWWHPPARRLSPTVIVSLPILQLWLCPPLMCLLRVPASQDVESHWLHLSGFSLLWVIGDNQLLRFQCSDYLPALAQGWLLGQRLHASWTQQWAHPGVNLCPILFLVVFREGGNCSAIHHSSSCSPNHLLLAVDRWTWLYHWLYFSGIVHWVNKEF